MSNEHQGPAEPRSYADLDPEALVRELRQQISAVRAQMEQHREVMEAAGLTSGDRRPRAGDKHLGT